MSAPEGGGSSSEFGVAAAFVAALVLAFFGAAVLAIIGAPPRLTAATPSAGVLLATCALGLALAARTLPEFIGGWATRAPRTLAFAFAAGALVWGLGLSEDAWIGPALALGALAHAQFAAPLAARGALSDGLATRFPNEALRAAHALVFLAVGALTATVGVRVAQSAAGDAFDLSTAGVDVALGITLALSAAPGGARAAVWTDGLCGALAAAFALGLAGMSARSPSASLAPLADDWAHARDAMAASPTVAIATIAALAGFAPLGFALGGAQGRGLTRAALAGPAIFAIGLAALSIEADALARASGGLAAIKNAFALLAGLALARLGVLVCARAFGSNGPPLGDVNIASLRLARLRLATVALCALFVALARHAAQPSLTMGSVALALSLALIAPAIALARVAKAGPLAAGAALGVGAAGFAFFGRFPPTLGDFSIESAGKGAVAAFAVGLVVALLFPRNEDAAAPDGALD